MVNPKMYLMIHNQLKKYFAFSLIASVITSCTHMETTTTIYHTNDFAYQGKSYNYQALKGQNNLQYDYAASLVDNQLSRYGMFKKDKSPDYTIAMVYGISDPHVSTFSKPIWGQTGVSGSQTTSSYSYDAFGNSIYGQSNTTYTPTYGIVGSAPVTVVSYMRYFSLHIYETKELSKGTTKPIYTMDVRSLGKTGSLDNVLPSIIYGGFINFPGNSGEVYEKTFGVNPKTMKPY